MKKYNKHKPNNWPQYVNDLFHLGLIKDKTIEIFIRGCRDDKSINVMIDKKSKVIFLDKLVTEDKYYKNKNEVQKIKLRQSFNSLPKIEHSSDNLARIIKYSKNKIVCDYGSGYGGNLRLLNDFSKEICGIEICKVSQKISRKNYPNIEIKNDINQFNKKFDLVTMFHVLAHLHDPLNKLKQINKKLNKGGKLVIETLHSMDWITHELQNESYNKFRFSREFLIFYTENSIKKILRAANFKNIRVYHYQRYGLTNFYGWIFDGKPGGHSTYKKFYVDYLDKKYRKKLEKTKMTDTLFVVATKE